MRKFTHLSSLLLVFGALMVLPCEAQYSQAPFNLSPENFSFQQKNVHHDNFYRDVTRTEKWKIGENYGSKLTYYSPRKDFAAVDDGFRIATVVEETGDKDYPHKVVSGYLTNNRKVSVDKAFRFITTLSALKDDFFIETSVPSVGNYAEVVCNFYTDERYDSFEITHGSNGVIVCLKRLNGDKEEIIRLFCWRFSANSIQIAFVNGHVRMFCDGKDVIDQMMEAGGKYLESFTIDKNRPIGIMVSKAHSYEYRVFDVYSIDGLRHIAVSDAIARNGIPGKWNSCFPADYSYRFLPTIIVSGIGESLPRLNKKYPKNSLFANTTKGLIYENDGKSWVETGKKVSDYGILFDAKKKVIYTCCDGLLTKQGKGKQKDLPRYVQRFELRAADVSDTKTAHCEITENTDFSINNYNLRRRSVSFKTLLPVSFLDDDNNPGGEALIQFQISTDGGKSRVPLFTIASEVVGKNKVRYHLNRRYIPTRPVPQSAKWSEKILGEDDVDLGKVKFGVWEHWEVYVKEGYMQEHCPLLVVKRNGEEVYRSTLPNTYNIMSGSYIRYGVYKSIYRYDDSERKRIVYIGDFECDI